MCNTIHYFEVHTILTCTLGHELEIRIQGHTHVQGHNTFGSEENCWRSLQALDLFLRLRRLAHFEGHAFVHGQIFVYEMSHDAVFLM